MPQLSFETLLLLGIRLLKTPMVIKFLFETQQAPEGLIPMGEPINDALNNPLDMAGQDNLQGDNAGRIIRLNKVGKMQCLGLFWILFVD